MGRTIQPYSQNIKLFEERMANYRRALRRSDQIIFDELMRSVLIQSSAGAMAASAQPESIIFLSMAIDLKREINEIRALLKSQC